MSGFARKFMRGWNTKADQEPTQADAQAMLESRSPVVIIRHPAIRAYCPSCAWHVSAQSSESAMTSLIAHVEYCHPLRTVSVQG